jgi:transposase InsO family protein
VLIATVMKRMGIAAPLLQDAHLKTGARPQYLLISFAKSGHHPAWAKSHSHACKHALMCSGAMEITCIPPFGKCKKSTAGQWMACGFIYLAAALDWFTRRAPSWRVSITLEAGSDIEAVEKVLARHGKPEIFNTDPLLVACRSTPARRWDSRFTSADFIKVPAVHKIKISMPLGDCRQSPAGNRRQGGLARQRLRRAPVARGGLPTGLRRRLRGPGFPPAILWRLQRPAAPLVA